MPPPVSASCWRPAALRDRRLRREAAPSRSPQPLAPERVATDFARDVVWDRLLGGALVTAAAGFAPGAPFDLRLDTAHGGEIVSARPGYHFAGTLADLDDSLLFVELEWPHVGLWLSTYGSSKEHVAALQRELDARVEVAGLGG